VGTQLHRQAAGNQRFERAVGNQPSEQELLQQVRAHPPGDPARQAACEALVARYEPVVRSCVNRYRNSPEPMEDLMQAGYLGLMKAISNYDPAVGDSLIAYALPCVTGEIKRHFRDRRWQIRVHRPAQELRLRIRDATGELTQQLARTPTTSDLARHLHVSEDDITGARLASQVFQIDSLDAPAGHGDSLLTLGDLAGGEDPELGHAVDMHAVWQHCDELPEREQRLLMMRFYGNMTQTEIGQQLGISQMHVSRLTRHALDYLRERLSEAGHTSTGIPLPRDGGSH
jgi:RNA polymerase sigma-B factor